MALEELTQEPRERSFVKTLEHSVKEPSVFIISIGGTLVDGKRFIESWKRV
jgi:hypothetical protein